MAKIYSRGGKYYVTYYFRGRRCRKSISSSKKIAELVLSDLKLKIDREEAGLLTRSDTLLSKLVKNYLEFSIATKAESSHQRDREILELHFLPFCKDCALKSVSRKTIEDYIEERVKAVTESTVNRELNTIGNLFTKAVEWGLLSQNPCKGVRKLKEKSKVPVFLNFVEIRKLLENCDSFIYPVVKLALVTGCRMGEIIHLEWLDVDVEHRHIIVQDKEDWHTKSHRHRIIPVSEDAVKMLVELKDLSISSKVFSSPEGHQLTKMQIHRHYRKALKSAGLSGFDFKALRHTYASHLVMRGVNIRAVQKLLGHSTVKTTERYSHLAPDHLESIRKFLDFIPDVSQSGHNLGTARKLQTISRGGSKESALQLSPFHGGNTGSNPVGDAYFIYSTILISANQLPKKIKAAVKQPRNTKSAY